jgi:bacteriorhodopsin
MSGLSGWVFGVGATVVAFILWLLVLLSLAFIKEPDMRYFYAMSSGFLTMLSFIGLTHMDEKHWINFPNSYYDVLGPAWVIAAVIITFSVLIFS